MNIRTVLLGSWATVGVPIIFALASYLSAQFVANVTPYAAVRLIVWLTVFVLIIASGLKALLGIIKANRYVKAVVGIAYAAIMYFVLLGVGFIGMCAYDCV
jgi:hypothetical protein